MLRWVVSRRLRSRDVVVGLGAAAIVAITTPARSADTKTDCINASERGQQLRDDGKYRSALAAFQTCSSETCPRVVSRLCAQWAHDLDLNMPTIVVGAKDAQGADIADAHASVDGAALVDRLDGKPVAIDPGPHVLRVVREGGAPAELEIVVRAGEKARLITLTLPGVASSRDKNAAPSPGPVLHSPSSSGRIITTVALAVVGLGVLGSGIYFGLHSNSDADTAASLRASIPSDACAHGTSPTCQNLSNTVDDQNRDATLNKVFLVAGGVFVAGAAITWFLWPKLKTSEAATRVVLVPSASSRGGGLTLGTRF
jgi:hypothetical protein